MSLKRDVVTRSMLELLLLLQCSLCLSSDHPVDLETKTNWYCYSQAGRWYWTGQSLEDGCYRYVCEQDQGILRAWTAHVLPHCCARNGKAYKDGEVIMKESQDCRDVEEVCVLDGDHSFVLKTVNNTCCGDIKEVTEQEKPAQFVQWFNYVHLASNKLLDVSQHGQLSLRQRNKSTETQKWRLTDGQLLNKLFPGKALGLSEGLDLSLVDTSSINAFQSLTFEDGQFRDQMTSYSLAVSSSGDVEVHTRAKRGAVSTSRFAAQRTGDVRCDELNWEAFPPFENNDVTTI